MLKLRGSEYWKNSKEKKIMSNMDWNSIICSQKALANPGHKAKAWPCVFYWSSVKKKEKCIHSMTSDLLQPTGASATRDGEETWGFFKHNFELHGLGMTIY